MSFKDFMVVAIQTVIFWVMTPCSVVTCHGPKCLLQHISLVGRPVKYDWPLTRPDDVKESNK